MRYIELFEGRDAPLYHGTNWVSASQIIEADTMQARTYQFAYKLFHKQAMMERTVEGVSLSRDYKVAKTFGEIVFVLDQRSLSFNHKMIPTDYFSASRFSKRSNGGESEEFVIGPIKGLDLYLTEIRITKRYYDSLLSRDSKNSVYTGGVAGLPLLLAHKKLIFT